MTYQTRGTPVVAEISDLRRVFTLKALAKITMANYETLKDHFYGVAVGIRNPEIAQRIRALHSDCKAKGWI